MTQFRRFHLVAACLVTAAFATRCPAADEAAEAAAALAKAPAAVQAAVKHSLGDHKLAEFDKEKLGEKVVYEAGYKVDGVDHAVLVGADGGVVQEEADVELSALPAAVKAAVTKAHPDGKLDEAALATGGGKTYYAVDVKIGDKVRVLNVSADGTVMADELETSAADEK